MPTRKCKELWRTSVLLLSLRKEEANLPEIIKHRVPRVLVKTTLIYGLDGFDSIDAQFTRADSDNLATCPVGSVQRPVLLATVSGSKNPCVRDRARPVRGGDRGEGGEDSGIQHITIQRAKDGDDNSEIIDMGHGRRARAKVVWPV